MVGHKILDCSAGTSNSGDNAILADSGYLISENGEEFPPLPTYTKNPRSGSLAKPVQTLNFQNVTIRRGNKKRNLDKNVHLSSESYTPISQRLEEVDRSNLVVSLGLRALSPNLNVH